MPPPPPDERRETGVDTVTFPFGQALPAAASLWKLALTILNDVEPARQRAARTAMEQFQGNYADQFLTRMQTSAHNAQTVAQDLEQAAMNIARAWTDANHQQQLYAYYAMVQSKKNNESEFTKVKNWFTGDHTNYGSPPGAPSVPSPPDFAPTQVPRAEVPGEVNPT